MSVPGDEGTHTSEKIEETLNNLAKDVEALYKFRDYYFEHHQLEMAQNKNDDVDEQANLIIDKFEQVDENNLKGLHRAKYLYLKGRAYNVSSKYDPRATQCLSKAVKLAPRMTEGWGELAESFWKNNNLKEAKNSLEGALQTGKNKVILRSLSIILRQELAANHSAKMEAVKKSVQLAKEAVALDIKDGVSWMVLGNAYLCSCFTILQSTKTLRLCLSAYKQAEADPIARSQPDLSYNKGMALKYSEKYQEALHSFRFSSKLDPTWDVPIEETQRLTNYLLSTDDLVKTKGKIKSKKLQHMIESLDKAQLGPYADETIEHNLGNLVTKLHLVALGQLTDGANNDKVILGRVVGSVHNESIVPFTFALVDQSGVCVSVSVYNMADGRGVLIGDAIALPAPFYQKNCVKLDERTVEFNSIRVDNPLALMVNGKRISVDNVASTKVSTTYKIY